MELKISLVTITDQFWKTQNGGRMLQQPGLCLNNVSMRHSGTKFAFAAGVSGSLKFSI
jgi:hypothetical protein